MLTGHWVELSIILIIALIVFGPQRLPELTRSLGGALREFRRATSELQEQVLSPAEPEPEEDAFPHIPPAPDVVDAPPDELTPTIDTLAQRREARQLRKSAGAPTAAKTDAESVTPADASSPVD